MSGLSCQLQESILRSRCESSHGLAVHIFTVAGKGFGISLTISIDGEDFFFDTTSHMGGA